MLEGQILPPGLTLHKATSSSHWTRRDTEASLGLRWDTDYKFIAISQHNQVILNQKAYTLQVNLPDLELGLVRSGGFSLLHMF